MASRRLVFPEITEQLTFNITIHIFHHISQLESHNTKQHKILSQLKMLILPLLIHTMSTLYITHSKPRRYLSSLDFVFFDIGIIEKYNINYPISKNFLFVVQATMHSAFSYDRRDPYTRLPIDTSQPTGVDPITSVHSSSINSDHNVSKNLIYKPFDIYKISSQHEKTSTYH